MTKKAMMTSEEYVEEEASCCPLCGSGSIEGRGIEPHSSNEAYRNVDCKSCGAYWTEKYQVVSYGELCDSDDNVVEIPKEEDG